VDELPDIRLSTIGPPHLTPQSNRRDIKMVEKKNRSGKKMVRKTAERGDMKKRIIKKCLKQDGV